MEDIAPKLLEKLQKSFQKNLDSDSKAKKILKKIENGTATYEDAGNYAEKVGSALRKAFDSCLTEETLPDGKMYWNIAEKVIQPMFEQDYDILSDVAVRVQQKLNTKSKIGLKAQSAKIDQSMITGVMNKAVSAEKYSEVAYVLREATDVFSKGVVDNTLKANVDFQGKTGRSPRIIRTAATGCCEWCAGLAGTYSYPNTPDEVYARHNNCNCIVEYDPGTGSSRQNVHTKQWTSEEESAKIEARKAFGLNTHLKTAGMDASEFARAKSLWQSCTELSLTGAEKEYVYEELDNNLTVEEKTQCIVRRPIGNYTYTAVNMGHNQYKIYKKEPIESGTGDSLVDAILDEVLDFDWRNING